MNTKIKPLYLAIPLLVLIVGVLIIPVASASPLDWLREIGSQSLDLESLFIIEKGTIFKGETNWFKKGIEVGEQGTGGVAFLNGTIINTTNSDGVDNPVTIGDNLRVDGELWRGETAGPGDNMPVKVNDNLEVQGTISGTLAEGTVQNGSIADNAITKAKIADSSITDAKLDVFNTPTNGQYLSWNEGEGKFEWKDVSTSTSWGDIQGTLSSQTDLQTSLDAKENTIAAGANTEYFRGDKSWETLDKTAVGLPNVEDTAISTWGGSANITTLGTVGTGTWEGTAIDVLHGGTGLTGLTAGDLLYADGLNSLAALPKGTGNQALAMNSGATAPEWVADYYDYTICASGCDNTSVAAGITAAGADASVWVGRGTYNETADVAPESGQILYFDNTTVVVDEGHSFYLNTKTNITAAGRMIISGVGTTDRTTIFKAGSNTNINFNNLLVEIDMTNIYSTPSIGFYPVYLYNNEQCQWNFIAQSHQFTNASKNFTVISDYNGRFNRMRAEVVGVTSNQSVYGTGVECYSNTSDMGRYNFYEVIVHGLTTASSHGTGFIFGHHATYPASYNSVIGVSRACNTNYNQYGTGNKSGELAI